MCYGDYEIGTRAGQGTLARQAGDDIAEWVDIAVGAPNDSVLWRVGMMDFAASGNAVPFQRQELKRQRMGRASRRVDGHGAWCGAGGARINCPRTKVSMMIMVAPQQRQTKVGGSAASDVESSSGCASERGSFGIRRRLTRARFSLRPALASKP